MIFLTRCVGAEPALAQDSFSTLTGMYKALQSYRQVRRFGPFQLERLRAAVIRRAAAFSGDDVRPESPTSAWAPNRNMDEPLIAGMRLHCRTCAPELESA